MLIPCDEVNILNSFRVIIILRLLLLLTNLHLKLLSAQGTGADKLLSTQRVKSGPAALEMLIFSNNFCTPFKVIDKFPIDGYLLPNNLGVAVVLFVVNTD